MALAALIKIYHHVRFNARASLWADFEIDDIVSLLMQRV